MEQLQLEEATKDLLLADLCTFVRYFENIEKARLLGVSVYNRRMLTRKMRRLCIRPWRNQQKWKQSLL